MTALTDLEVMLGTLDSTCRAGQFVSATVAEELVSGPPCESTVGEAEGITVELRRHRSRHCRD